MSADIGPGDVVICVEKRNYVFPQVGRVYRVHEVIEGHYGTREEGLPLLRLVGNLTENSFGRPIAYRIEMFRKLNDGEDDAELIARIKGRTPTRERVPA